MTTATEMNPQTPEQANAEATLLDAGRALLDAARAYDVAHSDDGDAERQPLAGPWALVALAHATAARALEADDLRLVTRSHPAALDRSAAPAGRAISAEAGSLGVYVVGGRGISLGTPLVAEPVDPDALALGTGGLRETALDVEIEHAEQLWHDRFPGLVAGVALARLDLPHAIEAAV